MTVPAMPRNWRDVPRLRAWRMVTVHGRTRCQFYQGHADWTAVRAVKDSVTIPVVVNGDIVDFDAAELALAQSGADAVMIGRGAQGRPWFPGQVARYLATGKRGRDPALSEQFNLIDALYDAMLSHHGVEVGIRHARKHLGWALDTAAAVVGAPGEVLKAQRKRVLTAVEPAIVRQRLAEGFDTLGATSAVEKCRMSAVEHLPRGFGCRRRPQCLAASRDRRVVRRQSGRRQRRRGSIFRGFGSAAAAEICCAIWCRSAARC